MKPLCLNLVCSQVYGSDEKTCQNDASAGHRLYSSLARNQPNGAGQARPAGQHLRGDDHEEARLLRLPG